MPPIIVSNRSGSDVSVFVSKYSGGDSGWFTVKKDDYDAWSRGEGSWEVVAFSDASSKKQAGVYVEAGATVEYRSLADIRVTPL